MRHIITRPEWLKVYYYGKERDDQVKMENESQESEMQKVAITLDELKSHGFIQSTHYDNEKFLAFRELVHENFFIFWTAISPPMERLLYALSYIIQPPNILGLGIFTGNPVVWSLGPAIQKIYSSTKLAAVEIDKNHARICNDNFIEIKGDVPITIHARDGFEVLKEYTPAELDLLYMDANGTDPETGQNSKRINYTFLKRGYDLIKPGAYAICHNAVNGATSGMEDYLVFTADETYFSRTATIFIDEQGLEVSIKNQ
nr:hypothetical protein [Candidatus Sigynarchaeota archaeon]